MNRKINILIVFSAAVLVALSAMQFYLVKTAYHYKVEQFHTEIKEKISRLTNNYSDIDSTIFNRKELFYKQLAENYIVDPSVKLHLKNQLIGNDFKDELTRKLQVEFHKEMPDLQLDFAIILDKFVIYNSTKAADTIFSEKPIISNRLLGNLGTLDNAFQVRNYVGTTSGILRQNGLNSVYTLLTEDTLFVSVRNWELIVLKRMILIFAFAILSILTLITLFVIAIKALIKQKKVSDVKTDFINNITHELKTPLTTLSVSTKILLRRNIRENEELFEDVLGTIDRQNNRLHHLIDQVMSSSLGFEDFQMRSEKVNANQFIQGILNDIQLAFPAVEVRLESKAENIDIALDKFHLTTALSNVLENAVKYGSSQIIIKTAVANGFLNIAIHDDGIGISKSNQPLLFDKFYRVEHGNLHNTKGLGLGLYYVDQIVKAHRGSIKVVSDLGKGSCFSIQIPAI